MEVNPKATKEHQQGKVKHRLADGSQIGGERTAGSGGVLTWTRIGSINVDQPLSKSSTPHKYSQPMFGSGFLWLYGA